MTFTDHVTLDIIRSHVYEMPAGDFNSHLVIQANEAIRDVIISHSCLLNFEWNAFIIILFLDNKETICVSYEQLYIVQLVNLLILPR